MRQIEDLVSDIPNVCPHYASDEGDSEDDGLPPAATAAERERFKRYGAVVKQ